VNPLESRSPFIIGVDLGQSRDHSTVAVLERTIEYGPRDPVTWQHATAEIYCVRRLERFPLGTPYPDIVEALRKLLAQPELAHRSTVLVDATGVGAPIVDYLRRARVPARVQSLLTTGGETATRGPGRLAVPRKDLVAAVHLLLEHRKLRIPMELPLARTLLRELKQFSPAGSEHDDLVLALSLAAWYALQRWPLRHRS
jgi:hypothetical protein